MFFIVYLYTVCLFIVY